MLCILKFTICSLISFNVILSGEFDSFSKSLFNKLFNLNNFVNISFLKLISFIKENILFLISDNSFNSLRHNSSFSSSDNLFKIILK